MLMWIYPFFYDTKLILGNACYLNELCGVGTFTFDYDAMLI